MCLHAFLEKLVMPLASHCPTCGAIVRVISHSEGRCTGCARAVFSTSKLAAGVFIERGNRVLLIRRGEEPAKGRWDVPGGFLEEGETPEQGARREIYEEIGVELGALDLFLVDLNEGGEVPVVDILYRCSDMRGTPKSLEVMEIGWFSADALPQDLAFEATHRLLAKWQDTRIRREYRLLDGTVLDVAHAKLISTAEPEEGALPSQVYVECGDWGIHDGAICGRVDGEQPAALWLKEAAEGDHLLMYRAYVVPPATRDINACWEGSGRLLGDGDITCTISGLCGWWDKLSGIERHPEVGLRMTTRKPPIIPGRVYEIVVGRLGITDFFFVDGELILQIDDPSAQRRARSQVALLTWNSHVHFLDAKLYQLPAQPTVRHAS